MEFTAEHKAKLEAQIVDAIAGAIDNKTISEEELSPISTFVLDTIDIVKNQDDLVVFLQQLAAKWSIFNGLLEIEKGEVKEQQEELAIHQVEQLVESGQIDQALALAKEATAPVAQI